MQDFKLPREYLIFAPHFNSAAEGHYAANPIALRRAFTQSGRLSEVIGTSKPESQNNFPPLPESLASPRPSISFKSLIALAVASRKYSNPFIVLYEGSFALAVLMAIFLSLSGRSQALVNIYDVSKHSRVVNSQTFRKVFALGLRILISLSSERLTITFDTQRFCDLVNNSQKFSKFDAYPGYSPDAEELSRFSRNSSQKHLIQILMRESSLDNLVAQAVHARNPNVEIVLHGASPWLREKLKDAPGVVYSKWPVSHIEYLRSYTTLKYVVFLYPTNIWKYQQSGRIVDCISAGVPFFAEEHTALGDYITVFGGGKHFTRNNQPQLLSILSGYGNLDNIPQTRVLPSAMRSAEVFEGIPSASQNFISRLLSFIFLMSAIPILRARWFYYHATQRLISLMRLLQDEK